MNLVSLKCPNCNADLDIEESASATFCSYCGSRILIDGALLNIKAEPVFQSLTEFLWRVRSRCCDVLVFPPDEVVRSVEIECCFNSHCILLTDESRRLDVRQDLSYLTIRQEHPLPRPEKNKPAAGSKPTAGEHRPASTCPESRFSLARRPHPRHHIRAHR